MSWFTCAKGVAKYLSPHRNGLPTAALSHEASEADLMAAKKAEASCALDSQRKALVVATTSSLPTFDALPPYVYGPDDSDSDEEELDTSSSAGTNSSPNSSRDTTKSSLEDLQAEINDRIQKAIAVPLEKNQFEFELTLQQAPRNQGRVDLMRSLKKGQYVAVKRMPVSWVTSGPDAFQWKHPVATEKPWFDIGVVHYLHQEGYQYVCEPLGLYVNAGYLHVVNGFATEGELFGWMDREPAPGPEREDMTRPIMKQIFSAVRQLHDLGIAHRDISLENILLTEGRDGMTVKLIDFGMATLKRTCHESCGKKSYIAPEMYSGLATDPFLTDAFAVGVVFFSLCCREYPWNTTAPGGCKLFSYVQTNGLRTFLQKRKCWRTTGGKGPRLAEVLSEPLVKLLEGLLEMQPKQRLTLGESCLEARPSVWDASDWI